MTIGTIIACGATFWMAGVGAEVTATGGLTKGCSRIPPVYSSGSGSISLELVVGGRGSSARLKQFFIARELPLLAGRLRC